MTKQQKTVTKILEFKEFNTVQHEAAVKKAKERLNLEQERLDALEREYKHRSDDFAGKQAEGTIPVQQMDLFYAYLKHLSKQIEHQKNIVAIRAAEHDRTRQATVEAYKEQRLFELLQDRLHREEVREASKSEQKEADYQYLARKGKR